MGRCQSKPDVEVEADPAIEASNDVEIKLLEDQIQTLFKFKILLLGAGESGKSTVVKQMKLIHKKKIPAKELKMVGTSLHQNVVDCMKALVQAVITFGTHSFDDQDKKTISALNSFEDGERMSPDLGGMVMRLWKSEAIQNAYSRRAEFWLLDSFSYYIKNLERFCEADFVPNEEDTVMARIRTTGIVVTELEQKVVQESKDAPDVLHFQVVDVGGQRNERKKWIHCFDDVKCILFIDNLAGYNQVLFEDSSKNRMHESLELFKTVTHNPMFKNTPIFLFLNKKDLFESMILDVDMNKAFKEYSGGKNLAPALDFIKDQFKAQLPVGKEVEVQIVTASWKRDIRCAFEEVKKFLYDQNRKQLLEQVAVIRKQQRAILAAKAKANQKGCGCQCGCAPGFMSLFSSACCCKKNKLNKAERSSSNQEMAQSAY